MHFGELHSNNSINDKNHFFENYIPKCYNVKRILISFNCFSEYVFFLSLKINFVVTNRADSNEMPLSVTFHMGLHCLPKYPFRGFQYTKG